MSRWPPPTSTDDAPIKWADPREPICAQGGEHAQATGGGVPPQEGLRDLRRTDDEFSPRGHTAMITIRDDVVPDEDPLAAQLTTDVGRQNRGVGASVNVPLVYAASAWRGGQPALGVV
jgi:hypothetical protein